MVDRRRFLYLSMGSVILAGIPVSLTMLKEPGWDLDEEERRLFARIAEEYFRAFPMERDLRFLEGSVISPEADFSKGETLVLGGWHLSRSEARGIALVALNKGYL